MIGLQEERIELVGMCHKSLTQRKGELHVALSKLQWLRGAPLY